MTTKTWARLDAAPSATHVTATVLELATLDASLVPGVTIFHAGMSWVDVTAVSGVAVGSTTPDGETFSAPVAAAPTPAQLIAHATAKQATLASGGLGVNVAASGAAAEIALADTDLEGRLNLAGLVQLAGLNANFSTVWVQSTGNLTLTASQITALGVAVGTFVEQTFQTLAQVLAAIAAGTITTTAQIDAAAWPATKA